VLQDHVLGVTERFPPDNDSVAWNSAAGGRSRIVKPEEWSLSVLHAATQATRTIDLDWSAVDVCIADSGRVFVLETNTAPGLAVGYRQRQITKAFMWLDDNTTPARSGDDFLHPALQRGR
jgi:D-alanine-D-alanine ligase-like ATP-grasp enzyme